MNINELSKLKNKIFENISVPETKNSKTLIFERIKSINEDFVDKSDWSDYYDQDDYGYEDDYGYDDEEDPYERAERQEREYLDREWERAPEVPQGNDDDDDIFDDLNKEFAAKEQFQNFLKHVKNWRYNHGSNPWGAPDEEDSEGVRGIYKYIDNYANSSGLSIKEFREYLVKQLDGIKSYDDFSKKHLYPDYEQVIPLAIKFIDHGLQKLSQFNK